MQRYQRVCIWIVNTSFCHRLVKGELGSCFYSHFTGVCLCIACSKYDRHTVSFVFSSVQFGRLCFVLFHSADSDYTLCLLVISVCWSCVHYHSALLCSAFLPNTYHCWMFAWEERALRRVYVYAAAAGCCWYCCSYSACYACMLTKRTHNCLRWKRHVR